MYEVQHQNDLRKLRHADTLVRWRESVVAYAVARWHADLASRILSTVPFVERKPRSHSSCAKAQESENQKMMRTVIYEKAGRLRAERELQIGPERWQLVTRLVYKSLNELVGKLPKLWKGKSEVFTLDDERRRQPNRDTVDCMTNPLICVTCLEAISPTNGKGAGIATREGNPQHEVCSSAEEVAAHAQGRTRMGPWFDAPCLQCGQTPAFEGTGLCADCSGANDGYGKAAAK